MRSYETRVKRAARAYLQDGCIDLVTLADAGEAGLNVDKFLDDVVIEANTSTNERD